MTIEKIEDIKATAKDVHERMEKNSGAQSIPSLEQTEFVIAMIAVGQIREERMDAIKQAKGIKK